MKTIQFFLVAIILANINVCAQVSPSSIQRIHDLKAQRIAYVKWDSKEGIPYSQVAGANLGATSFEFVDDHTVAFLCDASSEIVVIEIGTGRTIYRIELRDPPRDFAYDSGRFYVLSEGKVTIYEEKSGRIQKQVSYASDYSGSQKIVRYKKTTYLILPSSNSVKLENAQIADASKEYEGQITASGLFVKTMITGDNTFVVKVIWPNGISSQKEYRIENKVAGVFPVGASFQKIVIDVQTYLSENPIAIDRSFMAMDFRNYKLGQITNSVEIPRCYFVLSNRDAVLRTDGIIVNMISAPAGVYLFSIKDAVGESNGKRYPFGLFPEYHFNDHLMNVENR